MILGKDRSLRKYMLLLGIMGNMIFFPVISAGAAEESGCIQIEYTGKTKENKSIPLGGAEFQLYHVGYRDNGKWSVDGDLEQACVSLNEKRASKVSEQAEILYSYIKNSHVEGKTAKTDQNGKAVFDHLPEGLYLVAQSTEWKKAEIGMYQSKPYFVSIPMITDGIPAWEVVSKPKSEWEQEDMITPEISDQTKDKEPPKYSSAKTGDQSQIQFWMQILVFSLGTLLLVIYRKILSKNQKE